MNVEGNPSLEVSNLLLEIAWADYNSISSSKRDLEFKASIILAGIGVLLGIVISFSDNLNSWFVFCCLGFLVLSAVLCVFSISMRNYEDITLIKAYNCFNRNNLLNNENSAKESLYWSLSSFSKNNRETYNKSIRYLEIGMWVFLVGILILFLSVLMNSVPNNSYLLIISGS